MKVHHIAVQVNDLERSLGFYVGVLGLLEVRRQAHAVWLDLEGTLLMLELCIGSEPAPSWKSETRGLHLVALSIERSEREPWMQRFAEAGIEVEGATDFTLYVRDPDGTRVGLSHYPHR
jgi:catechol 2,3-dioxygenase-like lactoylglutathione lyase family enzyme